MRESLRKELQSLLDNANITPAGTRDLAHSFLESRKPVPTALDPLRTGLLSGKSFRLVLFESLKRRWGRLRG